ncbi:hypothetical protein TW65_08561 [Stemphylium lycopersici]|uniref:Uncharacterized protein n=1 Tax=Stemphylium lycopersici TaxID=183478 RepID=A0A364NF96_STELY|nr:hypothetical protein TW65_08561 [Stemphylium lycopersici]RAR15781.1 hypothetical protein DDE83_000797 [Stemphylium lycopersici]
MVRLFVPEGEGQHAVTRKLPTVLPAEPSLIASPWRSSVAAAGLTGFLALVGHSRPGTFLRSAAFFSTVDLSWTAASLYGQRELNRGIFKMEGIEPTPGKLWERTDKWSPEDITLGGGGLGIFLALNPRALPGATGISRFLGAATVGCALGFKVGQAYLFQVPPQLVGLIGQSDAAVRDRMCEKLLENNEAKNSLSRIGKLALAYHTSPYLRIFGRILDIGGGRGGAGGMTGLGRPQPHGMPLQQSPHGQDSLAVLKQEMDRYTVIQVEFKEGQLAGPDIEAGYRAYKDRLSSRDASSIQDWLERVQDLKKRTGAEIEFVWKHLAESEHEFYSRVEEDRERDILCRELQLLNNMAADLVTRYAILGYHEADARKQLQQLKQLDAPITPYVMSQLPVEDFQESRVSPHIVTEQVRTNWTRQKELLSHLENSLSHWDTMKPEPGTPNAEHYNHLKENMEALRKNVEATERLLRWFEDRVIQADAQVEK